MLTVSKMINNNKFSIFFAFLFIFSVFFAANTEAQSNSCPTIAPYKCNNGSCVNEASLCDQSWGGGLSTQNSDTETSTSGSTPAGQTLAPATPSSQQCTGNLRYDRAATERCARLAESEGRARGYNITCNVEERESVKAVNAAPVGSETMYFSSCTINGQTGFSPETLVGYKGSGAGIEVHDNFFGKTTVYGSGFNINSMWYSVPCALVDGIEGQSGTLVGSHTCTAGATQYFGSGSAANWTPANANKSSTGTNSGKTITHAGVTNNTSGKTMTFAGTSAGQIVNATFNSQAMEVVKRMLEVARNLYGKIAIENRAAQNNTSGKTSSNASTIPSVDARYTLTSDKSVYCVGDTPLYTITGGSDLVGKQILWSSFKDGISTNEFDNNYGHVLTQKGTGSGWSDYGSTWNITHVGKWKKEANVSGLLNTVEFEVKYCSAPQTTTLSCFPDTIRVPKYRIAFFSATNGDATFTSTYDWSAPQATRASGQGRDFATTYANTGTYNVTVKVGDKTDMCQVVVTN